MENAKYSVNTVAEYVLAHCTDLGNPISNLQLQKFLYYIQGYSYRKLSEPAFEEDLYCWTYGPVSPDAYYKYCSYIRKPIEKNPDSILDNPISRDKQMKKVINDVIDRCIDYSPSFLVEKTHHEIPWESTDSTDVIEKWKIECFFEQEDPLHLG